MRVVMAGDQATQSVGPRRLEAWRGLSFDGSRGFSKNFARYRFAAFGSGVAPAGTWTGSVGRILPLRHDALEAALVTRRAVSTRMLQAADAALTTHAVRRGMWQKTSIPRHEEGQRTLTRNYFPVWRKCAAVDVIIPHYQQRSRFILPTATTWIIRSRSISVRP